MNIPDYTVSQFLGLNTYVKDTKSLKPGIATQSLNWITGKFGDHIELRRGQALLGQTRQTGSGKVTGLGVGIRYDGVEVPFFSHTTKVKYYNATDDDTHEVGSDLLGAAANGDDVWFAPYANLAGSFMYLGSASADTYKIPVASPGSAAPQFNGSFRFGNLVFGQGRSLAGQRNGTAPGNQDKTGLYLSAIDHALLSDYSQTTGESFGAGDGTTKTFAHTLELSTGVTAMYPSVCGPVRAGVSITAINKASQAQITAPAHGLAFGDIVIVNGVVGMVEINGLIGTVEAVIDADNVLVSIDSTGFTNYSSGGTIYYSEQFVDDRDGNMLGTLGGTGTVDYTTGAVSVTFSAAVPNAAPIICSYYKEIATVGGVLDFDTSDPASGKAKIFRQDDGGAFMTALSFQDVQYAIHALKTWAVTISLDDTTTTNLPYRNVGISYPRAAYPTPDGILLIDTSNPNVPMVRRLEINQKTLNVTIVPTPISDALDLSAHAFDYAVAFRWGDLEIICVQEYINGIANTYNSAMYVRNVYSGAWDKLDYRASVLGIYDGALIAGDSISNNVFTLFSGFDDDDSPIDNYWQDGQLPLGTLNLKRVHFMRVSGLIQKDQQVKVSLVLDDGTPVEVFTIDGSGSYVDQGINTSIGSYTLGSKVIGGGGEASAHPFDVTFPVHSDRFQYISARFEALRIGYAAINSYTYRDIRDKGRRSLPIKTV